MKKYRVTSRDIRKSYRGYPFIDIISVKMPDGSIKHLSKTIVVFSIGEGQAKFYV